MKIYCFVLRQRHFHLHSNRFFLWSQIFLVEKLHSAFDYEENVIRLVTLAVQSVFWVHFHLVESWQHLPDEVAGLVIEEPDFADDLAVCVSHYKSA